ncbi:hypothetical protein [Galbibacter sp. PAP.153]|uniref:hypothetical protein n=1 Tax=Galbibacter sp. PAP.153 TaxID=3104623 RepID=UPI003008C86D
MASTKTNYKTPLFAFLFLGIFPLFSQKNKELKIFIYENDRAIQTFGVANIATKEEGKHIGGYYVINAFVGDQLFFA